VADTDPDIQAVRATTALLRGEADESEDGLDFYDDDDLRAEAEVQIVTLRSAADLLDRLAARLDAAETAAQYAIRVRLAAEAARETLQRECAEDHVLRGAYLEQIGRAEAAEAERDEARRMADENFGYLQEERARVLQEALRELVDLKDGPRDDDYHMRKPAAWENARRLVAFGSEGGGR
jgi:hypothetical protein